MLSEVVLVVSSSMWMVVDHHVHRRQWTDRLLLEWCRTYEHYDQTAGDHVGELLAKGILAVCSPNVIVADELRPF